MNNIQQINKDESSVRRKLLGLIYMSYVENTLQTKCGIRDRWQMWYDESDV